MTKNNFVFRKNHRSTMKKIFLCVVLATWCAVSMAQSNFSLNQLLQLADSNNLEIRSYKAGIVAAQEDAKATSNIMMPNINLGVNVGYLGNGYAWDRDFTNGQSFEMPHFSNQFSVEASQVVFAGGAVKSAVRLANQNVDMQQLRYEQNRQDVHFKIAGVYLDLYKMQNQVKVYDQNIELTQQLIKNIRDKQEQGTALKNDLTRYELQLANLQLQRQNIINTIAILNTQLCSLVGLSETEINIDTSFLMTTCETKTLNEWQHEAFSQSKALQQAALGTSMQQQSLNIERSAMLPKVAIVAQDHLNGPVTIDITPYDINYNYWFVGIGVQYDLASIWKNKRKVVAARQKLSQAQLQQDNASIQISNAVQESFIRMEESRVKMNTEQKKLDLANQNYSVIENRYYNDLALLTDMLDASNIKLQAGLELVNAKVSYIFNYYRLLYVCGKF